MLSIVTPPAVEPVSLAEAKVHLREDGNEQDGWITDALVDSRMRAERLTGRALITTVFALYLDSFYAQADYGPEWPCGMHRWDPHDRPADEIELRVCPVQAVPAIYYTGPDGMALLHLLSGTINFRVDLISEPARIRPLIGQSWPATQANAMNAVQIGFHAGYGDTPADVPPAFKKYILARTAFYYEHRGDDNAQEPEFLDYLLDDYRWSRVV